MKITKLDKVAWVNVGCETSSCAEFAVVPKGKHGEAEVALRFTKIDPSEAVMATRSEVAELIKAAKDGKLDYLVS